MFISKKRAKLLGLIMIPYLYGMKPVVIRASQKRPGSQIMVLGPNGEPTTPTRPQPAFGHNLTVDANANAAAPAAPPLRQGFEGQASPSSVSAQMRADDKRGKEGNGDATGRRNSAISAKQSQHSGSARAHSSQRPSEIEIAQRQAQRNAYEMERNTGFSGNPKLSASKQIVDIFAVKDIDPNSRHPKPGSQNGEQSAEQKIGGENIPVGTGEVIDLNSPDYVKSELTIDTIKKITLAYLTNQSDMIKGTLQKLGKSAEEFAKAYFDTAFAKLAKQENPKITKTDLKAQAEKVWDEILKLKSAQLRSPSVQPQSLVGRRKTSSPVAIAAVPAPAHVEAAAPILRQGFVGQAAASIPTLNQQSSCCCLQ